MTTCLQFLDRLRWIDWTPLRDHLEPYRRRLFSQFFDVRDTIARPCHNIGLFGRAKKNWKSADLCFAVLWALFEPLPGRKECFLVAFDEDQAANDLDLLKLLLKANPAIGRHVTTKAHVITRRDGQDRRGHTGQKD